MSKAGVFSAMTLLLALILTGVNLWLLPLGDGRDELAHVQLIDFMADQHRLPTLPEDWADAGIQAHQAPLYYMLMAGLVETVLPDPQAFTRYQPNPFANYDYYPEFRYNRVAYVNDWRGLDDDPIRTFFALRVISVMLNGLAVFFFWRAARLFFRDDFAMGVPLALAFLTLAPGFLQVMVGVNNNNLLFVFSALATWMLIRLLRFGLRWDTSIILGIALGLGMLTKLYMAPLLMATLLVYLHIARNDWRTSLKHLVLVGGLVMLIAGWWYIRNLIQYGDPTAANETEKLLQTARPDQIDAAELWGLVTLWGGKMWLEAATVYMTLTWLEVTSWILLVIFFGGGLALVRGRLQSITFEGVGVLVMGAFIPALLMAIYGAQRNLHGDQSPPIMRSSLPLLCLFFAASLLVWIPARWRDWIAVAGIMLLAGFVIFWQMTYFLPQYPPVQRTNALTHQMQIDFENGARLIDYQIDEVNLHQGDTATVTLCWQALPEIDNTTNAAFTVQLVHPEHPTAAATDGLPMSGRFPMTVWRAGEAFCEDVPLLVHEDAVTPRAYDVRVGLYVPGGDDLSFTREDGSQSDYLIVDQVGVTSERPERQSGDMGFWVQDIGYLRDYDLAIAEGSLELRLNWFPTGTVPTDYNMFLHVLDDSGDVIAQVDRPPLFPTRFWQDGAAFEDTLSLDIPDEAAAFHFGLYDPVTGTRAMWQFPNPPDADHIILDANR